MQSITKKFLLEFGCKNFLIANNESKSFITEKGFSYSDRVVYIYKYLKQSNLLPKIEKPSKNNKLSEKYKELGNEAYRQKKLREALELYNKSIAYAEQNSTECLALAFGNRSAVLFEMKYYKECEEDIDRALSLDYPEAKKEKLIARKNKIKQFRGKCKNYRFFKEIQDCDIIKNKNDVIKCASKKIKLNYSAKYGRHIVATDNIEPGEVIAVEEPYVALLIDEYYYKLCSYCFNHCLNLIPCNSCSYALFCNDHCKRAAMDAYHKYECQYFSTSIFRNFEEAKAVLFVLRIIISARGEFEKLKSLLDYDESKFGLVPENGKQVLATNYMGLHYLMGNYDMYEDHEKYIMCTTAAIILNILEQIQFFNGDDDMLKICSDLALRHLLTVKINCHSTYAQITQEQVVQDEEIGIVLFCFLSLLNHSCFPNVFRTDRGRQKILRATRTIKKGEQIYDCYTTSFNQVPKSFRQMQLTNDYKFKCECEACLKDWLTSYELDWINTPNNIRLPKVYHIYQKLSLSSETDELGLIVLRNRNNIINAKKMLPQIKMALKQMANYINYFEYWEFEALLRRIYTSDGNTFWMGE